MTAEPVHSFQWPEHGLADWFILLLAAGAVYLLTRDLIGQLLE